MVLIIFHSSWYKLSFDLFSPEHVPNALFEIIYSIFMMPVIKCPFITYILILYLPLRTKFVKHVLSETEQQQRLINCYNRATWLYEGHKQTLIWIVIPAKGPMFDPYTLNSAQLTSFCTHSRSLSTVLTFRWAVIDFAWKRNHTLYETFMFDLEK